MVRRKRDENHCWRCGNEFYKDYLIGTFCGVPVYGNVGCVPDFDGAVLCRLCTDKEVEEQMIGQTNRHPLSRRRSNE